MDKNTIPVDLPHNHPVPKDAIFGKIEAQHYDELYSDPFSAAHEDSILLVDNRTNEDYSPFVEESGLQEVDDYESSNYFL